MTGPERNLYVGEVHGGEHGLKVSLAKVLLFSVVHPRHTQPQPPTRRQGGHQVLEGGGESGVEFRNREYGLVTSPLAILGQNAGRCFWPRVQKVLHT